MNLKQLTVGLAATLLVCMTMGNAAASTYSFPGPAIVPESGPFLPPPARVPGKELSLNTDRNAAGGADAEQNIAWDGVGGTADTFDYSGSRDNDPRDRQVDAISNATDSLFGEVLQDRPTKRTNLLFSTTDDPNIYYERPMVGGGGVWAAPLQIDDEHPVNDVDGLEVWLRVGTPDDPPNSDDAFRYSLVGDPDVDGAGGTGRVSIWRYDNVLSVPPKSFPVVTVAEIAGAIGADEEQVDLDALMFVGGDFLELIFSVAPIPGQFDGGEIWHWVVGFPNASFLNHGGHVWNTAFDVMGTFNTASENINALEAASGIPEPAGVALLGLATACAMAWRKPRV